MSLKNLKTKENIKKSPASDTWAAIAKNTDFPWNCLKVTKLSEF